MAERGVDVVKLLMKQGKLLKITDVIDADTAELIAEEFGHTRQARRRGRRRGRPVRHAPTPTTTSSRGRRSSPSWATSTTARPRCSTRSARPTSSPARPAASPSTSAPTRSTPNGEQDHLPRHAGPRGLHRDARPRRQGDRHRRAGGGGRRRRHAADDRGDQPRQGGRRADDRRDQQDRQARRRPAAGAHRAAAARDRRRDRWAARCSTSRSRRQDRPGPRQAAREPSCSRPSCSTSRPIPTGRPKAR